MRPAYPAAHPSAASCSVWVSLTHSCCAAGAKWTQRPPPGSQHDTQTDGASPTGIRHAMRCTQRGRYWTEHAGFSFSNLILSSVSGAQDSTDACTAKATTQWHQRQHLIQGLAARPRPPPPSPTPPPPSARLRLEHVLLFCACQPPLCTHHSGSSSSCLLRPVKAANHCCQSSALQGGSGSHAPPEACHTQTHSEPKHTVCCLAVPALKHSNVGLWQTVGGQRAGPAIADASSGQR